MKLQKLLPVIAAICLAAAFGFIFLFSRQATAPTTNEFTQLSIGGGDYDILLADDAKERKQGLSGRQNLAENQVMLFVFDEPAQHGIWMKDMLFPLDIVWLDTNKQVTHLEQNVSPGSYPQTFIPPDPSLYVLEFNVGQINKTGLMVGDSVDF